MKSVKSYGEKKISKIKPEEFFDHQFNDLIKLLQKELPKFKEVNALVLFGSFARGDYSIRHSDIDLMIFLDKTKVDKSLEEKIRKGVINLTLGKELNVHLVFQYKKIEEEDNSLMLTISKEGKVIFARKTIIISGNILGLKPYYLLKFDTTNVKPVIKNKLQRFLYGYKIKGKKYRGIVDEEIVLNAGKGAIIVPNNLLKKVLLYSQKIDIKVVQKAKFYK